jgi:hypothetical protein
MTEKLAFWAAEIAFRRGPYSQIEKVTTQTGFFPP